MLTAIRSVCWCLLYFFCLGTLCLGAEPCLYSTAKPERWLYIMAGQSNMAGLGKQPQRSVERVKIWGIYGNSPLEGKFPSEFDNGQTHHQFAWSAYAQHQQWRDLTSGYGVKVGQDTNGARQWYGPEISFGRHLYYAAS